MASSESRGRIREWQWDPSRQLYYIYDPRCQQFVFYDHSSNRYGYENYRRTPRSVDVFGGNYGPNTAQIRSPPALDIHISTSPGISTSALASEAQAIPSPSRTSLCTGKETPRLIHNDNRPFSGAAEPQSSTRAITTPTPLYSTDSTVGARMDEARWKLLQEQNQSIVLTFRLQKASFFRVGRVFQLLWSEPAGEPSSNTTSSESAEDMKVGELIGKQGKVVYSTVRRFVVIREGSTYCNVLPIVTYGRQGVGKRGVMKSEHAIIHTGIEPPDPQHLEMPSRGEQPMRPSAIRITTDNPTDKLDPMSRLNLGKVYTVEHNVRTKSIGMVHPGSKQALQLQFTNVLLGMQSTSSGENSTNSTSRTPIGRDTSSAEPGNNVSSSQVEKSSNLNRSSSSGSSDSWDSQHTAMRNGRPHWNSKAGKQKGFQEQSLEDESDNESDDGVESSTEQ